MMISLYSVDLSAVFEAWRKTPLDRLVARFPRGRVAAIMAGPLDGVIVDGGRPAPQALGGVTPESRREAFDALVEDLADEALHDAPADELTQLFATIAKLAGRATLHVHALDAAAVPAYPPELLDAPSVEDAATGKGLMTWLSDPSLTGAARDAVRKGSFTSSPPIVGDLADILTRLLDAAARPGQSLVAQRA
jgi:hypothetical protein